MKKLFIAEKPSVAREFAKVVGNKLVIKDGYIESGDSCFTWCVGHLVKMSYPEAYDERLRKWSLNTIPFIPNQYKYEVIKNVKKQFNIIKTLINHKELETIYVCTDSGREGEYIYRLLEQEVGRPKAKRLRVWIDSQTEEEILRGVDEAKELSYYDNLSDSAYLRAKEDYLMGINFSRLLSLTFSSKLARFLNLKFVVIAVGRVMSCVLGMVVDRENEIRKFEITKYFKPTITIKELDNLRAEWRYQDKSKLNPLKVYKKNGIIEYEYAKNFIDNISNKAILHSKETKKEIKNPPYLYNLSELQNECSKSFKISPDKTLEIAQELYEKKMITYPRTDSKFLSSAVTKQITNNLKGLSSFPKYGVYVNTILENKYYTRLNNKRYTNDSKVTDHYAIIPTGRTNNFAGLTDLAKKIFGKILLRFLSTMFEPAEYKNTKLIFKVDDEEFHYTNKELVKRGYLDIIGSKEEIRNNAINIKKNQEFTIGDKEILDGETTPPKRYTTGSIILAMENAGSLIEDEELRAVIKSSGIGTSATRAEILKKLQNNSYININDKTQVIYPTLLGEAIFEVVKSTIPGLLNPKLSASWEKGLTMVQNGEVKKDEYMAKLSNFVTSKVNIVKDNYMDRNLNLYIDNSLSSLRKYYRS